MLAKVSEYINIDPLSIVFLITGITFCYFTFKLIKLNKDAANANGGFIFFMCIVLRVSPMPGMLKTTMGIIVFVYGSYLFRRLIKEELSKKNLTS